MKLGGHGKSSILTEEIKEKINKELDYKYQVLFDMLWYSGCRVSEALQIRWCDISSNTIIIRKGNTKNKQDTRELIVPQKLIDKINRLPNTCSYIFAGYNGNHLTRFSADKNLRNACKKLGLVGYSTHSYRRSVISQLHERNIPIKVISTISGHRSLASISHYIDINDKQVLSALQSRWV
jgi:integrase/recombinase XerD